jgi:enoyl-CoA hydratase/carnithine racemase
MCSVYAEVDPSSGLGWVWIDHPQRQNAMSIAMWERLREVFEELARDVCPLHGSLTAKSFML